MRTIYVLLILSFAGSLLGCDDDARSGERDLVELLDAQGADTDAAGDLPEDLVDGEVEGTGSTEGLAINEACPRPDAGADWFELYALEEVSLQGCVVVDDNPDHEAEPLPVEHLAAGEWLQIYASDEADEGESPAVSFKLGRGDSLTVTCPQGEPLVLEWEEVVDGQCVGLLPDGTGATSELAPTPGAANQAWEEPLSAFDLERVVAVELELSEAEWQAIQDDPQAETYYEGAMIFDGARVEQVGIRVKGNSSLNGVAGHDGVRFSFKVDINLYRDQRFRGVKKLNFNNGFKDPSLMRDALGYAIAREAGLPAPRTGWADLSVAGQHLGLYTIAEQVDGDFIDAHFADDSGDLYKPEPEEGNLRFQGPTIDSYSLERLDLKTNEESSDHSAFLALVETLDSHPGDAEALAEVLDLDEVSLYLAFCTALTNLDSYYGLGHNYYLYEQEGVFSVIPWDLNESFGSFTCACDSEALLALPIDEPTCGDLDERPLVAAIFGNPQLLAQYHQHLEALFAGPLAADAVATKLAAWQEVIEPYVELDPTYPFTLPTFQASLHEDVTLPGIPPTPIFGLTSFVERRSASVAAQLAGTEPSTSDGDGGCGPVDNPQPCGDGICDEIESANPALCPQDCS